MPFLAELRNYFLIVDSRGLSSSLADPSSIAEALKTCSNFFLSQMLKSRASFTQFSYKQQHHSDSVNNDTE